MKKLLLVLPLILLVAAGCNSSTTTQPTSQVQPTQQAGQNKTYTNGIYKIAFTYPMSSYTVVGTPITNPAGTDYTGKDFFEIKLSNNTSHAVLYFQRNNNSISKLPQAKTSPSSTSIITLADGTKVTKNKYSNGTPPNIIYTGLNGNGKDFYVAAAIVPASDTTSEAEFDKVISSWQVSK